MREAQEARLKMLPYRAGFFLSIPTSDSDAVCNLLHEDNIFAVPLAKGVRIAVCAVTKQKIIGMAAKVAKAVATIEK
jgi:aromatic-amino-acid transaminase